MSDMTPDAKALADLFTTYRTPPAGMIAKLPKPTNRNNDKGTCNVCKGWHGLPAVHLDYMGHAEVTDALTSSDPCWSWAPMALDDKGLPAVIAIRDDAQNVKSLTMWITLTVHGHSRPGVGTCDWKGADTYKELIGDAIRNAAMRFGVGLSLWSKAEGVDRAVEAGMHVDADSHPDEDTAPPRKAAPAKKAAAKKAAPPRSAPTPPQAAPPDPEPASDPEPAQDQTVAADPATDDRPAADDGAPVPQETLDDIGELIGKLRGPQARAYADYRRKTGFSSPADLDLSGAFALYDFLEQLVASGAA